MGCGLDVGVSFRGHVSWLTLFNLALTPEDTSEFLSEELFAQKLASFAASSEHPDAFWMGLDDGMKAHWELHPDAVISSEAARTLQDAKRVVAVIAFSLDPAIREGASKRIFEDVEKLEAAGRNTTKKLAFGRPWGLRYSRTPSSRTRSVRSTNAHTQL